VITTVANATTAGAKAFYQIASVVGAGGGSGTAVTVGTTDKLGIPVRVMDAGYMIRMGWNNTLALLASFKANLDAAEVDKLTPIDYALGRSRVGFLQTKPPVRTDTAEALRKLGATAENANLPPWPGVPTPTLTAKVPE
jgi:hypothetical protein